MIRAHLYGGLGGLCILNALVRPIQGHVLDHGFTQASLQLFGLNLVIILASTLGIMCFLCAKDTTRTKRIDLYTAFFILISLVIPFATAAWASLLLCMLLFLWFSDKETLTPSARAGALIFIALSAREPIAKSILDLMSEDFLTLDAAMVASLLDVLGLGSAQSGNLITGPDGHQLLVLTGCSSFSNLSFALLAWFAVSRFLLMHHQRAATPGPDLSTALGLSSAIVGLNVIRLVLMALGPASYDFFHNGFGVSILEASQLLIVGGAVYASLRSSLPVDRPCLSDPARSADQASARAGQSA